MKLWDTRKKMDGFQYFDDEHTMLAYYKNFYFDRWKTNASDTYTIMYINIISIKIVKREYAPMKYLITKQSISK